MGASPRIEPTAEDDWDDETRELLDRLGRLNIFTTIAHHPKLLKRWLVFASHVLAKSTLPPRDREIAILRAGWRCSSPYEFGQHTMIGESVGITPEEVRRLTADRPDAAWSDHDAALISAVDELVDHHRVSDATWEALARDWSTQQLMDLVFTVGQYVMTCMALNSFGVELEEGAPGFPDGAVGSASTDEERPGA